jgi:hypothetical protein
LLFKSLLTTLRPLMSDGLADALASPGLEKQRA